MLDVFGLKKEDAREPAPQPGRSSAKLWAAALIVDSLFVIVFGGAVAAKVYQHWKAPAPEAAVKRAPAPKPAPKPEPPKPPEEPKAAEAPKPEPAKPEPKPAAPEPAKPLARPSLLSEPPRRQAPQPQGAASSPAPAANPQKAQPVEFKLKAPNAKRVFLVGAFIVRGGRKEMARGEGGVWTLTLYLTPNTYRYHFLVDGKRQQDPENPGSSLTVKPQ